MPWAVAMHPCTPRRHAGIASGGQPVGSEQHCIGCKAFMITGWGAKRTVVAKRTSVVQHGGASSFQHFASPSSQHQDTTLSPAVQSHTPKPSGLECAVSHSAGQWAACWQIRHSTVAEQIVVQTSSFHVGVGSWMPNSNKQNYAVPAEVQGKQATAIDV